MRNKSFPKYQTEYNSDTIYKAKFHFDKVYKDFYKRRKKKMWGEMPSKGVTILHDFLVKKGLTSGKILDVGGGEGRNTIYLAKAGFYVECIEISEVALNKAKEWAKQERLQENIQFIRGDIINIQFPLEYFDAIIDIYTLPFIYSKKHTIYMRKVYAILKPSGIFLLEIFSKGIHSFDREYLVKLLKRFQIISWIPHLWYWENIPQNGFIILAQKTIEKI